MPILNAFSLRRKLAVSLLSASLLLPVGAMFAQTAAPVVLHAAEAQKLLPDAVYFRGQSAPVQKRNSAGIHFAEGMYVLVALVDNSGYSSGVQQKYQAYFITETTLDFGKHHLQPGVYGVGIVGDHLVVMDVGAHDLFTVPAAHDEALKRPSPLQLNPDGDHYRLYFGRNYAAFSKAR